jgi:hypothetical protein
LADRHGLAELLDRLADLISSQARLDEDADCKQEWDRITNLLEAATSHALTVATMKNDRNAAWWK